MSIALKAGTVVIALSLGATAIGVVATKHEAEPEWLPIVEVV